MSACTVRALRNNPELLAKFRNDPLSTLEELQHVCKSDSPLRLTAGELQLLKELTREEFEMLYSLVERFGNFNLRNFKL